jgi:hypothetical protein
MINLTKITRATVLRIEAKGFVVFVNAGVLSECAGLFVFAEGRSGRR